MLHLVDVPPRLYRAPGAVVAVVCSLAVFLPGLIDSDGLAFQRTYVGEIAAINAICQAIPANSSVLIDDYTMNQQFAQAIRGTCGVPVAGVGSTVSPGVQVIPVNAGTSPGPASPPPGAGRHQRHPAGRAAPVRHRAHAAACDGLVTVR